MGEIALPQSADREIAKGEQARAKCGTPGKQGRPKSYEESPSCSPLRWSLLRRSPARPMRHAGERRDRREGCEAQGSRHRVARIRQDRSRTQQVQEPACRSTRGRQSPHADGRHLRRSGCPGTGPRLPRSLPRRSRPSRPARRSPDPQDLAAKQLRNEAGLWPQRAGLVFFLRCVRSAA
jgi:hypothetical protein